MGCLLMTTYVCAKTIQIAVKPEAAASSAQILDAGRPISGANGLFTTELGFLKEKTLVVQADGFDTENIFVSFKHKQSVYEVMLKPNRKRLNITTSVPSSTIYVDGIEQGKGTASVNIKKDTRRSIKIVADGYDTFNTNVNFSDAPGLIINKDYKLVLNRKECYISVNQIGAKVYADGVLAGVMTQDTPVKVTVHKGKPLGIRVTCAGFMDLTGTINFENALGLYNLGDMPIDEAYNAIAHDSKDLANTYITIRVRDGIERDVALTNMKYYITNEFRNLEVNDNLAGWIRTKWNVDKYPTMQVRTRIELKQVPSDGDGLKFRLLIESQKAAADATLSDENFKDWDLLLKKYSKLSVDIRNAVE